MPTTQQRTWRAGRFWWDAGAPTGFEMYPLRAVIFDLDALADIECDGHRLAFNAAFVAHGLDIEWTVERYRQLLALGDERRRVAAELRKRGVATECDVLTELLADEIYLTKTMIMDEFVRDADLTPREGLLDLIVDAFAAGIRVAVVANGQRSWVDPLVRQLVGDGLVETVVTADDVNKALPDRDAYVHALGEFGLSADNALAIAGSAAGLRAATAAGLPTVVITGGGAPNFPAATAVRPDYGGSTPLRIGECQRLHGRWMAEHKSHGSSAA